jgi:C1A family cysteine protease
VARGPVIAGIDASDFHYTGRYILSEKDCTKDKIRIDHAVTIVGYTRSGYYKVKNSWGQKWGDGGYFYVKMASGKGVCGLNTYLLYPIV